MNDDWLKAFDKVHGKESINDMKEILCIKIYKTESGGIASETKGYVKGTKDLLSVNMVLSQVLESGLKMLGENNGIIQSDKVDHSKSFKGHNDEI